MYINFSHLLTYYNNIVKNLLRAQGAEVKKKY